MKIKKSIMWLIVWAVLLLIGYGISMANEIAFIIKNGATSVYPPYQTHQWVLLFLYQPLLLLPSMGLSFYYAIKEKVKPLKIIAPCIIFYHMIVLVGAIIDSIMFS